MFKTWIRSGVVAISLVLLQQAALAADISVRDVYVAAEAGRLNEAQEMMQQVLRDHPSSANAHFVEAELLSKQGKQAAARAELAVAEKLAPGLPFAKPAAVDALKRQISGNGAVRERSSRSIPWGVLILGVGVLAFIALAVRSLLRQRAAAQAAITPYNPNPPPPGAGYGPGYGPGPGYGGGLGGGIMGGLATGAALGAGMVAGEALAHRLVDDPHGERVAPPAQDTPAQADESWDNSDMGGTDFGLNDSSSWDDGGGGDFGGGDDWS